MNYLVGKINQRRLLDLVKHFECPNFLHGVKFKFVTGLLECAVERPAAQLNPLLMDSGLQSARPILSFLVSLIFVIRSSRGTLSSQPP